jgi:pyridoxine 4-dehydrogenase
MRGVILGLYQSGPDRKLLECALNLGVCGIDTAYNYGGFASHRTLARVASGLLDRFTLSTKVGFFPPVESGQRSSHSLAPARLRAAVEQSADELGQPPDVVFLHNPERTVGELPPSAGADSLAAAGAVLADAVKTGLCGAWGIGTWDPQPILAVAADIRPGYLLLRAGLSVTESVLTAGEQLAEALRIPLERRWGMSPFGGDATGLANLDALMAPGQQYTDQQAAYRAAFELPRVSRIAVSTSKPEHLADLVEATGLAVDPAAVVRYRAS